MPRPTLLLPLFCALGLAEVAGHYYFKHCAPDLNDWREVAQMVKNLHRTGDLVAIAPNWGEPLARHVFGDGVMPIAMIGRSDNASYRRALEVDFLNETRLELASWREVRRERVGPFVIRVRENPTWEALLFSFAEHVGPSTLSVSLRHRGREFPCPFMPVAAPYSGQLGGDPPAPNARFDCSNGNQYWVGVTTIENEEYLPRRCIWTPLPPNAELLLRFRSVPLGKNLVGYGGAPWMLVREVGGPAVPVNLHADGVDLGTRMVSTAEGFARFTWSTRSLADTTADIAIAVSNTTKFSQRFCFTLESR